MACFWKEWKEKKQPFFFLFSFLQNKQTVFLAQTKVKEMYIGAPEKRLEVFAFEGGKKKKKQQKKTRRLKSSARNYSSTPCQKNNKTTKAGKTKHTYHTYHK